MAEARYACLICGTWVCQKCGWKNTSVSVLYSGHACPQCRHETGTITPTMHTERAWLRHNGDAPLPEGYPYGTRPEGELQAPFGTRTAAPPLRTYRGVPAPEQGPYQRLDLESWKRGVEDALKYSEIAHDQTLNRGRREGWDLAVENTAVSGVLSDSERHFLAFALDQVVLGESLEDDHLLGQQFTDEDRAALEKLRRLTVAFDEQD